MTPYTRKTGRLTMHPAWLRWLMDCLAVYPLRALGVAFIILAVAGAVVVETGYRVVAATIAPECVPPLLLDGPTPLPVPTEVPLFAQEIQP